jgi:hypothetical protein
MLCLAELKIVQYTLINVTNEDLTLIFLIFS